MSRGSNDSGSKYSGRQGGGKRRKSYARGNSPIKKKMEKSPLSNEDGIRLNKFIANSGVCSRREADMYIAAGNVTVNGQTVTEMGYRVKLTDDVRFDNRRLNPEKPEYILLNKPAGFFVTGNPEKGGRTVMELISKATSARVSPIGKLDNQAKGLLLFTNDGTLAKKLAKPKNGIRQIYQITLDKNLSSEDFEKIKTGGVFIEGSKVSVTAISFIEDRPHTEVGLELNSIKEHIVTKIFKSLGYNVESLDRVVFGGLTKKDLPRGRFRNLTQQEVINLGML
ncbi:MAG: pseudouridine synthase [Bacteroidota bacterium]|uniref:Ribosomal large subunit pseudouridine synthase B n=1 Tax=Christiangramia flava JLT2011 TaxID=1229726 RepID=A0A1L7I5W0_9FLAO|nr:pseudouridine synthase [Christiangramia flava]APU68515.1 Ribosomal large subunit pseudouridine synthase B [Christiangramia flava JLT2011]MEE2771675.1 pseudouridine synthase [Bacteroidota bacterium]OSS40696.1 Ribosomal large subunit pseudouridine synthase B [Christiangramia flava JLT2011]